MDDVLLSKCEALCSYPQKLCEARQRSDARVTAALPQGDGRLQELVGQEYPKQRCKNSKRDPASDWVEGDDWQARHVLTSTYVLRAHMRL